MVMIKENKKAPDFNSVDQSGNKIKLSDFIGKWVLLYFYPKDNTPGCTKEACALRDTHKEFTKLNAVVLGVSKDSEKSNTSFIEKFGLPFTLISDKDQKIIKKYGADGIMMPKRVSFLINPEGIVRKIYSKVKPETHASEVIKDLKELS